MAVLSLVDTVKDDLKFLHEQPSQILADFCKLAWSFICKGPNVKLYLTASQKLHIDVNQIQSIVESLANFFIEAGKNKLEEEAFKETITDLGFSKDLSIIIYNEYVVQKNVLMVSLPQASVQHSRFRNLEWRFETQVSSKSIKKQIQPRIVIKLDLEKGAEEESICLQTSINNMIHINHILSQALQDSRTQHSKRIQRNVS